MRGLLDSGAAALVLIGHGTAWTLLIAELTSTAPDLDAWRNLLLPDHCELDVGENSTTLTRRWGHWI